MGRMLMDLLLLGGVGWTLYYLLRALGRREMAALLQIACYCVAAVTVLQLVLQIAAWVASTRLYQILEKFGRG